MKFTIYTIAIFTLSIFGFASCEDPENTTLPNYSGSPGELIVVSTKNQWAGNVGKAIKEVFYTYQYGLPQKEPYFNLVNTNESDFESIFKTFRNVLVVEIDTNRVTSGKVEYHQNVWAQQQLVAKITAGSTKEFIDLLNGEKDKLISSFNIMELNRLYARNQRLGSDKIEKKIAEEFDLEIIVQKGARIAYQDSQALWIRIEREKPIGGYQHQISQGLLFYRYPYSNLNQFLDSNMFALRDSIMQVYLRGTTDNTYIMTEYKYYPPVVREINFDGHFGQEIRGLWKMHKQAMGGPMVSYFILDEANQEIISAHAYVFAPEFDKREFLREVEAIVRSMKLKKME